MAFRWGGVGKPADQQLLVTRAFKTPRSKVPVCELYGQGAWGARRGCWGGPEGVAAALGGPQKGLDMRGIC